MCVCVCVCVLTFSQGLLQQVVLGLQLDDEVAAIQVLLEFLQAEDEGVSELMQLMPSDGSRSGRGAGSLLHQTGLT